MHVRLGLRMREGLGHVVQGPAEILVLALARLVHSAAQHVQRLLLRQQLLRGCIVCQSAGWARGDACITFTPQFSTFLLELMHSMPSVWLYPSSC